MGDVTRTGWVQIADALFWAALVISVPLALMSSGGLSFTSRIHRVTRASTPGATQGEEAEVVVDIQNRRPWPRFGLTLTYDLQVNDALVTPRFEDRVRLHLPFLAPYAHVEVRGRLPLVRRGLHRLSGGAAVADAPFGFFRRTQRQPGESSLLVHPAAIDVDVAPARQEMTGAVSRPVTVRVGEEVLGSRPFAIGDPARDIHWRNSARAGRIMTKSFTATEAEAPVLVIGVSQQVDDETALTLDDLCRVAAGVARSWGTRGTPLTLLAGSEGQTATWDETLSRLAKLTVSSVPCVRAQLKLVEPGRPVMMVADATDRDSLEALSSVAGRLGAVEAWLLGGIDSDEEWRVEHAATVLRRAGVNVTVVDRPLPAPRAGA